MSLLTIAIYCTAFFATLIILMDLVILASRRFAQFENNHIEEFYKKTKPYLQDYLKGKSIKRDFVTALKKTPSETKRFLMEYSEKLDENSLGKLRELFASFPYVQEELEGLKSSNFQIRLQSAENLGYLRDPTAIPSLVNSLYDESISVRFAAAFSLARLECVNYIEQILFAFRGQGLPAQLRVARILLEMGPKVRDPVLKLLLRQDNSDFSLCILIRVIGMLCIPEAVPRLKELLHHYSIDVRRNSVRALTSIRDLSSIAPIATLARDSEWEVRNSVMHALGRLKAVDQIPLLYQGLSDLNWSVRSSAAHALQEFGQPGIAVLNKASKHHVDAFARDISVQVIQEHRVSISRIKEGQATTES